MLISKIELKNITTHAKTIIDFKSGINLLAGQNGTGKSTILKMIGFDLFDYLPGRKQNIYVRNAKKAEKSGIVKVWIVGKDNQEFLIERSLGKKPNYIKVLDVKSNTILEKLEDRDNFQQWLKIQAGMQQDQDLSRIFQNAIGVEQGTFTEPFLRRPADRRDFFNPLLNVEIYQEIYTKSIDIIAEYKEEMHLLQLNSKSIETQVEHGEKLLKVKDEIKAKLAAKKTQYEIIKQKLTQIVEIYNSKLKFKTELEELTIKQQEQIGSLKNFEEQKKMINIQINSSKSAKIICEHSKDEFSIFEKALTEQKKLTQSKKKFDQIKDQIAEFEKKLATIDTTLNENSLRKEEIDKYKEKLEPLKKTYLEYQENSKLLEELQSKYTTIIGMEKTFKTKKIQIKQLMDESKGNQIKLKKIPELQKKITLFDEISNRIQDIIKIITQKETLSLQLTDNKKKAKGGKCPFLDEKCKNIEGNSLEEYFQKKLDKLMPEISALQKEKEQMERERQTIKESQISLEKLLAIQGTDNQLKIQIEQLTNEIGELDKEIMQKDPILIQLTTIKQIQEKATKDVESYLVLRQKITQDLPLIEGKIKVMQENRKPLLSKLKDLKAEFENLIDIPAKFEECNNIMEKTRVNHSLYQENYRIMEKLPDLEKLFTSISKNELIIKHEQEKLMISIKSLNKQYDKKDFLELEAKKESLNNQTIRIHQEIADKNTEYENIEKEIQEIALLAHKLRELLSEQKSLQLLINFTQTLREWFKSSGPKITEALLNNINKYATEIFKELMGQENFQLIWQKDYDILVITDENQREFAQLSGGEQMAAALAIRLAILRILTSINFAIFDEPTTNLDREKRNNLASCIQNIRGFDQIFVISHDDTFEEHADHVIRFEKDENEKTTVNSLV